MLLPANPNSGKTTMYNALTGKHEHVGNWAGGYHRKKGKPHNKKEYSSGSQDLVAVDLPGGLFHVPVHTGGKHHQRICRDEHPDAIINIVDATNLSRSLFFTTQLLELGYR